MGDGTRHGDGGSEDARGVGGKGGCNTEGGIPVWG